MADVNPLDALDEAPSAAPAPPQSALADAPAPVVGNPLDAMDYPDLPSSPGLVQSGTIKNIWDRPVLHNPDGSISTTLSFSIGTDKGETLIPQVVDGKKLTREEAIDHYRRTGEHLGVFDTPDHADDYAQALHNAQWDYIQAHGKAQAPNPLDAMDSSSAADSTADRMREVTDQAQIPEVTVSAKRDQPPSSWEDVARGIPTAIGAGIETKAAGAQEFLGHTAYDDARKKFWQASVLPAAVRQAQKDGVALTELPEVQDAAKHLGIRPDTFTRDWPTYVNQSPERLNDFMDAQRDRIQTGAQQIASGTKKRLTAQQVQEAYAPNMDTHSLKSLAFDTATMIPDILAGVGGTIATGGVGGAAIMAADIAPSEYAAARAKGLDHTDASTYAVLSTIASSVPEVPVLKIVENTPLANKIIGSVVGDKLAATAAGKVAGTAAAQGVTQSVVNTLQQAIDAGVLNEHLPLDEALKQIAWSGLVGGVVGAPMGAFHAATSRTPKPTTFKDVPEAGGGNGAEEVQAPSVAPPSVDEPPSPIDVTSTTDRATQTENNSTGPTTAVHAALVAMKDQSITPPQVDLLERQGLIARNDLNQPKWLPAGRRRLVELNAEAEKPAETEAEHPVSVANNESKPLETQEKEAIVGVESPETPPESTEIEAKQPEKSVNEATPDEKAVGTADRLRDDDELRQGLTAMKEETGWSQIGGRVIRDASTDQVTGRTSWIPNADWWPGRPKGIKEGEIHTAVDKALAGQPLRKREQAMVDYMAQVHDERVAMASTHDELAAAVPNLRQQPEGALDLTLLASRAAEHDPNEAARVMDLWEDDKPETIARVRGEFEQIIGRGQENAFSLSAQEGRGTEPAPVKRSPAALDLFGDDRSKEQALTDEARRRDQSRSPNRDVSVETGNPGDLFSQARRQKDFTDQLKAAREDTELEPTDAQKHAGNYAKGEVPFAGMTVTIENPKGSTRHGVDNIGERWSSTMAHDYGYINRTVGADRDHVDAFLTGKPDTGKVFVVNQLHDAPGKPQFDEHKVILGAADEKEARETYQANYPKGWRNLGSMAEFTTSGFKEWLKSGTSMRPVPTGKASELQMRAGHRTDYERRKAVSQMTPEEMKRALLTHELTGIPNRRAYNEAKKLPHQVSIDVDSLKWVNDNMGHESGNELLKAIASSLSSHADNVFHLSGDEFASQAHTETEAHELMRNVSEHLKNATMEVEMPDGRVVKLKGMGVSYGVGKTLEEADAALQSHKNRREAEGVRAGRGQAPPGATVGAREEGREDKAGGPAEGVEPKSRRTQSTGGLDRSHVEGVVHQTIRDAQLTVGFPHVQVHQDTSTLPERIQDVIAREGAESTTGAVYDPANGHIHLIADNNGSDAEVRENLWHEAVGHHGLRMAMDRPQYNAIMDGIARDMPERVQAAANRNSLDLADPEQKRAAAEEVIAYAAGQHLSGQPIDKPVLPYWTRAVRAVKSFFARMTGKPFYDDRAISGLIQQARRALEHGNPLADSGNPRRSTRAPIFYSPVERAVTESKQGKASAEQWLATIKKAQGIKPEELEWLNLEPWLKGQTGPITKEQISDYVRANQLHLQETLHGGGGENGGWTPDELQQTRLAEQLRAQGHEVVFDDHGNLESIGVRAEESPTGMEPYFMHEPDDVLSLPEDVRDVAKQLDEVSARVAGRRLEIAQGALEDYQNTSPQYGDYTLPGGKNYRELLMRLPAAPFRSHQLPERKAIFDRYAARIASLEARRRDRSISEDEHHLLTREVDQLRVDRDAEAEKAAPEQLPYQSSHWREPNIVAHTRFNERTDPDGKKVLHIEEIQSDWHQAGRKVGYKSPEDQARYDAAAARYKEFIPEAREVMKRNGNLGFDHSLDALDAAYDHLDWRERWSGMSPDDQRKIDEYIHRRSNTVQLQTKIRAGVPDAPFKTSWPMLAMKRMIRWAAENGFERISWTTGAQQNERYNLSKHYHTLDWSDKTDGGRVVKLLSADHVAHFTTDPQGKVMTALTASAHDLVGHDLSEVVGAELARKILGEETGRLKGQEIDVGGGGMKGFYDQILPRETNKLIKKYGGQVDDGAVNTGNAGIPLDIETGEAGQWGEDQAPAHGFDITDQMRQAALGQGFPLFSRRQSELPLEENRERGVYAAVRRAVNSVSESAGVRDIRKLINPAGMSPESRQVARITAESLGQLAHETVHTQETLEAFSRIIDKTPIVEQLAMMDAIEKGEPQPDPSMQPVADAMRKMLDTWRGKVQGLGEGYLDNFIENYFPHYWRRGDEAQRLVASIMGRRPLRGPASFLKLRTIPSIKEGMDAGLTPLTTNPLIMTLLKTREMQRFVSGVTLMRRFKEDGLANFLPAGRSMPDGWAPINDNIAKVRSWSEAENGFIERGQYIMPIDAARVINNHVSASLLKNFAPTAIIRRGANALNAMQLGFSAFHLGFTTLDAMISKNAQGIERLMHGEVGSAVRSFSEGLTPVGAYTNVRRGYKLLHAYSDPTGATPDMKRLVQALEQAGGRAHMDRYYQAAEGVSPFRGVGLRSLANDVRAALTAPTDRIENLGRALGSFPIEYGNKLMRGMQEIWATTPAMEVPVEMAMRVVRASTAWIMEHLVPMQKLGVFSDLAADHLRRNPAENPNDRAASMQRIWASVDNRLGEMVYDNLFWNRTLKDSLHLGIRAVGWNVGTIREIAGAPIDIVKAVDKGIRTGKITADDLGHRIPYVMSMAATTALYAAAYQYMATGQGPQELKDYFFPRSGGVTNYGTPQRVSLPSYVKDVYEYTQRPGTTVVNKLNPIFSLIGNLYSNQDFFGNPITDPEASYWTQKWQQLKFAGGEFTPFSLQGRQQMEQSEAPGGFGSAVKKALPMVGVMPAPGYITSGEQMERRKRLEDDQKYTGELRYQIKKAISNKDKARADEITKELVESLKRMGETKKLVGQDKAKAAVARRKAAITMRQSGYPATADLVASLPLEPDAAARRYFTDMGQQENAA